MAVAASVALVVYRELEDDYVGLWIVPWHVRRALPEANDDEIREISTAVLVALVTQDALIGDLDETTGSFTPWDTDTAVNTALSAWLGLGRDPDIGEVAWLALPS